MIRKRKCSPMDLTRFIERRVKVQLEGYNPTILKKVIDSSSEEYVKTYCTKSDSAWDIVPEFTRKEVLYYFSKINL